MCVWEGERVCVWQRERVCVWEEGRNICTALLESCRHLKTCHSLDACSAAALATAATAAIFEEAPSAAEFSSPGRTGPALGG